MAYQNTSTTYGALDSAVSQSNTLNERLNQLTQAQQQYSRVSQTYHAALEHGIVHEGPGPMGTGAFKQSTDDVFFDQNGNSRMQSLSGSKSGDPDLAH